MKQQPKILGEVHFVTADPVTEVNNFLADAAEQELKVLQRYNLCQEAKTPPIAPPVDVSKVLERAVNKVYSYNELSKLAVRYDLKLLAAELYHGPITTEMAWHLTQWEQAKLAKGETVDPKKLLILAPREMFVKKVVLFDDPIAFYPLEENEYFEYVGHCGDDLTADRQKLARQRLWFPNKWVAISWKTAPVAFLVPIVIIMFAQAQEFLSAHWQGVLTANLALTYWFGVFMGWSHRKHYFAQQDTIVKF